MKSIRAIEPAHLLVIEEELEVLELATGVRDLVGVAVESLAVLMLWTSLIVGKHANTILHGENLVVYTTVVAILVAQIVKSLAKLSNKLVLLWRSDLHTTCLVYCKIRLAFMCIFLFLLQTPLTLLTLFDIVSVCFVKKKKINFNYSQHPKPQNPKTPRCKNWCLIV